MKDFILDDLRIDITLGAGKVRMEWLGVSRVEHAAIDLSPFLDRVTRDVQSSRVSLELHLEGMQFCNSTTIAAIVRFVKRALDQGLHLELSFEPRRRWQQVLADTLTMFDPKDGRFRLQPLTEGPPPSVR